MFYLRATLIIIWFLVVLIATAIRLVIRPWDPDTDRIFLRWLRAGARIIVPLQIQVEGSEYLEMHRPCVLAANHQHILDAVVLSEVFTPNTIVTGKIELKKAPLFGWVFDRAANVWLDRSNRQAAVDNLQKAGKRMQDDKLNLWIFPEGHLNGAEKGLQPFKKGAFHIGIQLGVPIVPIVFSPSYFLNLERRRLRPGRIWVRVLEPIPTNGLSANDVESLLEQTYQQMAQAYSDLETLALPQLDDEKDDTPTLAPAQYPHSFQK